MRIVVADTGPLYYLFLISEVDVLPQLFASVAVPQAVVSELCHTGAPASVRSWALTPPPWLVVHTDPVETPPLPPIDAGERAAIALALLLGAELLLMDERAGTAAARGQGLQTVGTIGVLKLAAQRRLIELPKAFAALRATNFYYPPALLDALLVEDVKRRRTP